MKHTASPWSLNIGTDGAVVYKEGIGTIANIPIDIASFKAHARLIAAAPDLLEALEECMYWLDEGGK